MIERRAAILGVVKINGANSFKVINFEYTVNDIGEVGDWKFKKEMVDSRELLVRMRNGLKVINGIIAKKDGSLQVVGNYGSFSRFKTGRELVVLSEIKYIGEDRVIGYKLADSNGNVTNLTTAELLLKCAQSINSGCEFPMQNASFVNMGNGKPFIRKNGSEKDIQKESGYITEWKKRKVNGHTVVKEKAVIETEEHKRKVDVANLKSQFTPEQLEVIAKVRAKHKHNWKLIANPLLTVEQMIVLGKGLDKGVDISLIAKPQYRTPAMKIYIEDLTYGLDISHYLNSQYTPGQISELSMAYEAGLDLADMANPNNSADDMSEIRQRLEKNIWKTHYMSAEGTWY